MEYYLIQKGDTLSAIAKKYYGNANDYPRIFEANREVIKDAILRGRQLLYSIVDDITERKRIEEALERSEAFQRAMIACSPVAL